MSAQGSTVQTFFIHFLAILLLLAGAGAVRADVTPERQHQLIHLLRHDCGSCHGMTLKGGLGPPLLSENLIDKSPDVLENIIYLGLPERAMPPWEGLLTRAEIRWLVERLQKGDIP
ncbi:MAG: cytochrome c [Magnetococcales bacterium]|nr:cytochrome c [Magnetococcales bacterium]